MKDPILEKLLRECGFPEEVIEKEAEALGKGVDKALDNLQKLPTYAQLNKLMGLKNG